MKFRAILASIWVLIVVPTMAYGLFIDSKTSQGNYFSATTLQTTLTSEKPFPVNLDIMYELPYSDTSFVLTNSGQLSTTNTLTIDITSNPTLASLITVSVELDETTDLYTGPLNLLNLPSYLLQSVGQSNKLGFLFSISEADYNPTPQQSTTFKLKNHAWQTGLPFGSGFFDNEYYEITLTNPKEI